MSERDSIKIKFSMTNAVIDRFQGSLDHYAISIAPINQSVKMPENLSRFQGLNLADAHLVIDFYNAIEMPIQIRGKFSGANKTGASATLEIESAIAPCTLAGETLTSMPFDSPDNKQLMSIVNLMPDNIQFSGSAFVGDGFADGEITPDSYIRGSFLLETPAVLSWKESSLQPDTTYLQINPEGSKNSDMREGVEHLDAKQTNVLREFVITAEIENHLPVGATIEYRLADVLSQAEDADLVLAPVEINAASIDLSGRTAESFTRNAKITLGGDDIAIFHNDSDSPRLLSLVSRIRLHGTDGEQVKVYDSDFIAIRSMAKVVVGMNMD